MRVIALIYNLVFNGMKISLLSGQSFPLALDFNGKRARDSFPERFRFTLFRRAVAQHWKTLVTMLLPFFLRKTLFVRSTRTDYFLLERWRFSDDLISLRKNSMMRRVQNILFIWTIICLEKNATRVYRLAKLMKTKSNFNLSQKKKNKNL